MTDRRNTGGRPAVGPVTNVRLTPDQYDAVDRWAAEHDVPSRAEAIRQLIDRGLDAQSPETI